MRTWHRSCMKRTFGQSNDVLAVDTFPLGVWKPVGGVRSVRHMGELVEKVGPVRHTEARRKVRLARRMGPLGPLGKCALLGVWKLVEGMHSFRRWQKTPQWGPIAWIWERAARKRHDGAFSRADILRRSFRKIT